MNKNTEKISYKTKKIKHSFTGRMLTNYAGLSPIMQYIDKEEIGKQLNSIFPTEKKNATKFSNVQVILGILLASLSGVNRVVRISNFTADSLVKNLLNLKKHLNKDVIGQRLKKLGQKGSVKFQEYTFRKVKQWVEGTKLKAITIDCDSTVQRVYGNQEGAAKGYNSVKKGAKSYHPLLAFITEMKIVVNNRFRTGSAYTSNGILSFIRQTSEILPEEIKEIFFRADSGFFNGKLFDLVEELQWDYLIKAKLKNMNKLLEQQKWEEVGTSVSICEFEYQAKNWEKARKLKAIRTVSGYTEVEYFGQKQQVPVYQYACYCSSLEVDAKQLHEKYKERSTSENWIEQVKNQVLAGKTLTNNFHANDLLWQIAVFAYNISVMMRYKTKKHFSQEHNTFREWFIELPGKILTGRRQLTLKIYENYYFRDNWENFTTEVLS
ncbi:MAG: IS1380 family transposase [Ignavibacteria bacterium]